MNILSKKDQSKAEKLGIASEVAEIILNCECGEINKARLIDLSKLRKWEIMEVIGNYIDPRGEVVENWHEIKRLATFCKAFNIAETEINEYYTLGICEGGYEIAYITENPNIILVLWEEETTEAETEETEETLDPLKTALKVSQSKPSSNYNLKPSEEAKGFYFEYMGLKVPFKVLLNENQKTEGIAGLCFGTAKDCPSLALGLCQLPTESLCYARAGEKRASRKDNTEGLQGMDSYYNGLLCGEFWDTFANSPQIRLKFIEFLDSKGIDTLRFNLKGDFRSETDILSIYHLANSGFKCSGYTARDDLAPVLEVVANHKNIWVNGSNRFYTNRFKATDSLKEYQEAKYKCLGSCSKCRKCYTLRGVEIIVLVHGSGSDTLLNNSENFEFLKGNFKPLGVTLTLEDFERAKGLTTCLNKALALRGCPWDSFKDAKDILNFIRANQGAII